MSHSRGLGPPPPPEVARGARSQAPPWSSLLAALGLLVAVRAVLVLALADVFFVGEELAHGAAAKAILDRLPVALPRLSYQYYEGGGLLASVLTAPLFALLGPCHLANKLVALGFDAANLAAGFWLCWRCFGPAAARVFALLYVFAPAAVQQIALLNVGNHHAAIVFFFLLPLLALPLLRAPREGAGSAGPEAEPGALRCLALGLVAGLGVAFNLMVAPLIGFLAVALVALRPRLLHPRVLALVGLGFALGSVQLIWTALVAGSALLDVHGIDLRDPFGAPPTSSDPGNTLTLILRETGPRAELVLLGLLALPLLGALARARSASTDEARRARLAHFLLLAFLAVFTAASVFSRFHPTYFDHWSAAFRYLPHWGLAVVLAASAIGWLLEHPARGVRLAGALTALALAGAGLASTVSLAVEGKARDAGTVCDVLLHGEGFDYNEYLPKLAPHLEGSRVDRLRVMLHLDDDPRALYPDAAWSLYESFEGRPATVLQELREAGGERWMAFLPGLGKPLLVRAGGDLGQAVQDTLAMPPQLHAGLLEGIGRYGRGGHTAPWVLREEIEELRLAGAPPAVFRGIGQRIHAGFRLDPLGAWEFVSAQDASVEGALAEGLALAQELGRTGGTPPPLVRDPGARGRLAQRRPPAPEAE